MLSAKRLNTTVAAIATAILSFLSILVHGQFVFSAGSGYPTRLSGLHTYTVTFPAGTNTSGMSFSVAKGLPSGLSITATSASINVNWSQGGQGSVTLNQSGTALARKDVLIIDRSCSTPPPPPTGDEDQYYTPGQPTVLHLDHYKTFTSVLWSNNSNFNDVIPGVSGLGDYFTTPAITENVAYFACNVIPSTGCASSTLTVSVLKKDALTKLKSENVRVSGVTSTSQIANLPLSEKTTAFTYFDGFGRVSQSVIQQASPSGQDVIAPLEYDEFGRVSKRWLPFSSNVATAGTYRASYQNLATLFYSTSGDAVADDVSPFSTSKFEQNPLGRLVEQGNYGSAYQIGTGKTLKVSYGLNVANEVRMFDASGNSTQFYPANKLAKTTSTDPEGAETIVFTDVTGRTILKKQFLNETIEGQTVTYLETYYIYDDFGRLKFIISPRGVSKLKAGLWSSATFTNIKDHFVYQFVYDARGRLTEKKIPGQAWTYMGYDKLNRLVLVQDGILRGQNKWMFIKYDRRGRAVINGLYKNTTETTRSSIQAILDGLYTASNGTYPTSGYFESRGTALHGYSNTSFPKTNADNTAVEVLAVNYFDTYDFDFNGSADYSYVNQGIAGEQTQDDAYLRPTGSKKFVLGAATPTWLYTYVFYDKYGRPIQVRTNNHMNPTVVDNLRTTVYDFEGKVLQTKNYHNAGSGKVTTVINKFSYDDQGRLIKVYQNNNAAPTDQLIAQYFYNELGQLIDKKLHNTSGTDFLQSVDYRYTIAGQLSSINNATLTSDGSTNDETNDYFGMELLYNTTDSGLGNTAYFNGNISAIKWKGIGDGSSLAGQRAYYFTYDKTQKLETAPYKVHDGSAWTKEVNTQNESLTYDHNGNILSLVRNQRKHQISGVAVSFVAETIDNLTYTYNTNNGNSLEKVTDAASIAKGFDNGTSGTGNDYTYDPNGNLTADANKGITVIYNVLGKPSQTTIVKGGVTTTISYMYDATGSKLQMKTVQGGTTATTDYVGGFVYENNTLSFFGSNEGRVVKNGSNLEYQYAIADNQGNTRVVFSSVTPAPAAQTVDFESTTSPAGIGNYNNRVNWELFDHTDITNDATEYSQKLTAVGNSRVGAGKFVKVYPGDKVKIEAYAKYYNATSDLRSIGDFGTALISAFNATPIPSEATNAVGINSWGGFLAGGGSHGTNAYPKAFVNLIVLNKSFQFLDAAWDQINGGQQIDVVPKAAHDYLMQEYTAKEEGWIYVYVSNENATAVEVYFDDITITETRSNVVQYNEYYPFGLQTENSWTRAGVTGNNYLYNAANELNRTSGWYEMHFRGYDPAMGRMLQVDPYAAAFSSMSPYNFSGNNPIMFNDPSGGIVNDVGAFGPLLSRQNMITAYTGYDGMDAGCSCGSGGGGNSNSLLSHQPFYEFERKMELMAAQVDPASYAKEYGTTLFDRSNYSDVNAANAAAADAVITAFDDLFSTYWLLVQTPQEIYLRYVIDERSSRTATAGAQQGPNIRLLLYAPHQEWYLETIRYERLTVQTSAVLIYKEDGKLESFEIKSRKIIYYETYDDTEKFKILESAPFLSNDLGVLLMGSILKHDKDLRKNFEKSLNEETIWRLLGETFRLSPKNEKHLTPNGPTR